MFSVAADRNIKASGSGAGSVLQLEGASGDDVLLGAEPEAPRGPETVWRPDCWAGVHRQHRRSVRLLVEFGFVVWISWVQGRHIQNLGPGHDVDHQISLFYFPAVATETGQRSQSCSAPASSLRFLKFNVFGHKQPDDAERADSWQLTDVHLFCLQMFCTLEQLTGRSWSWSDEGFTRWRDSDGRRVVSFSNEVSEV